MVKLRKNKVYFFLDLDLNKWKYKSQLITPLVLFHSITNTCGQTVERLMDTLHKLIIETSKWKKVTIRTRLYQHCESNVESKKITFCRYM